jgi:hypothetical protein
MRDAVSAKTGPLSTTDSPKVGRSGAEPRRITEQPLLPPL